MAERFKLKLSRVIPSSLLICRRSHTSASVHTPEPGIYRLSPVNSKAFDISFPAPPPTTPVGYFIKRHVSTTKVVSVVEYGCRTKEPDSECSFGSPEYTWKKKEADLCHHESEHTTSSPPVRLNENKNDTIARVSSRDSACFSRGEYGSETLISCLSNQSSTELDHSPEITSTDSEVGRNKKKKVNTNIKQIIRRRRRKASMDYNKESYTTAVAGAVSPVKTPVFRRTIPGGNVNGKVGESVAVVKKSVDPYEDFKRSMLEMILQKQIFEVQELEQLLSCFLSLNSKKYHQIIVEAFTDIWENLFCCD